MNLPQLYYLRKLAEVQHHTEVAKALYTTQSSSSDSIAPLEKELGVFLFQKKGRSIQLTKYGKESYQYVNESLGILEHGISLIKERPGHTSGSIDIGYIPTLLGDFLLEALGLYHEKNPLAAINIYHGMSIEVAQDVPSGRYDIGFCSMMDDMPDLVFVPITYQEPIAIVQNSRPLTDRGAMYLSDLSGCRLTTHRDTTPIGKTVHKLLKKKGVEAVYSYDDEISIAGRISNSLKVAIVTDTPFLGRPSNLSKVRLLDVPKDTHMIYMVYSSKNFITSAVEAPTNFMVAHRLNVPEQDSFTPTAQLSHKTQKRNCPLLSEPEERFLFPYSQLSKM